MPEQEDTKNENVPSQQQQQQLGSDGQNSNTTDLPLSWTQLGECERPPAMTIRYPEDVAVLDKQDTEIILVGTAGQKITNIGPDFYKTVNPGLKQLVLRSHLIRKMEGLQGFTCLELLELYDNQVDELSCLSDSESNDGAPGRTLRVLDMSFNVIRDMAPVSLCPNLQELYLANNKLKSLTGLKHLVHLKKLDLGANRIRVMDAEELSGLLNLEELWLGKNKIEEIQGLEKLTKLRRLDVQSNRLTAIENLSSQRETLEELYLAHNAITTAGASMQTGLAMNFPNLSVLDLSRNRLTSTAPFAHLKSLDELWISGNEIASFDDVEPLRALGESLDTLYLEYNPLQEDPLYRKKLAEMIPSLTQIDANLVGGLASQGFTSSSTVRPMSGPIETEEERLRRLRDMAIERAKKETK